MAKLSQQEIDKILNLSIYGQDKLDDFGNVKPTDLKSTLLRSPLIPTLTGALGAAGAGLVASPTIFGIPAAVIAGFGAGSAAGEKFVRQPLAESFGAEKLSEETKNKKAIEEGLFGAASPFGGKILSGALKLGKGAARTGAGALGLTPEKLMSSLAPLTTEQIKKQTAQLGTGPFKRLLELGVKNADDAEGVLKLANEEVAGILKPIKDKIPVSDIQGSILKKFQKDLLYKGRVRPGMENAWNDVVKYVDDFAKTYKKSISPLNVEAEKETFANLVRNWANTTPGVNHEALLKTATKAFDEAIEKVAPAVKAINKDRSLLIAGKNAFQTQAAKSGETGMFGNIGGKAVTGSILGGTAGTAVGFATGGPEGALKGATIGSSVGGVAGLGAGLVRGNPQFAAALAQKLFKAGAKSEDGILKTLAEKVARTNFPAAAAGVNLTVPGVFPGRTTEPTPSIPGEEAGMASGQPTIDPTTGQPTSPVPGSAQDALDQSAEQAQQGQYQFTADQAAIAMLKYPKYADVIQMAYKLLNPEPQKLSQTALNSLNDATELVVNAYNVRGQLSKAKIGQGIPVIGGTKLEGLKAKFGMGDPATLDLQNSINNLFATIAKARGGTALSESEQKILAGYVPKDGDSRQQLQFKLDGLINYGLTKRKILLSNSQYGDPNAIDVSSLQQQPAVR